MRTLSDRELEVIGGGDGEPQPPQCVPSQNQQDIQNYFESVAEPVSPSGYGLIHLVASSRCLVRQERAHDRNRNVFKFQQRAEEAHLSLAWS